MAKKKRVRPSLTCAERLIALKLQHSKLDEQIAELHAADPELKDLKKQKLRLKDDIARIERTQIIGHLTGETVSPDDVPVPVPTDLLEPVSAPCDFSVAAE